MEYKTIDGNKLAPYPDMTDEELSDFERYEFEQNGVAPMNQWDWWVHWIKSGIVVKRWFNLGWKFNNKLLKR